jgi:hypothetical protein
MNRPAAFEILGRRDHKDGRHMATDDIRDQLPDDLNAVDFVGAYRFPDNSRRRIPGVIYVFLAAVCIAVFIVGDGESALVNDGYILAASILGVVGLYSLASGWRMTVDEKDALERATRAVGFAVGHASAQQVWRGVCSRPTWRMFCYSAEDPPIRRGLVLIDAIDGRVVECLVESNPDSDAGAPDALSN